MPDPQSLLAGCRAALDVRAELARKATAASDCVHWPADILDPDLIWPAEWDFIAANSPDQVLADVESKRLILDGWEQVIRIHEEAAVHAVGDRRLLASGRAYDIALAGLSSMARALGVET